MSRRSLIALGLLAALLAGALAWWFGRPPSVAAVSPQARPLVRTLQLSARVASSSRVDLGSTITGRVSEVLVREGQTLRRGQPLLRLESEELGAALAQAQANERLVAARLAGLRGSGRRAAEAAVAQTDSVLQAAASELRRARELVAQGFVSQSRLDEAQRAVDVALAQQSSARAQREANAEQGSELAQAQAQLSQAVAATAAARARLEQASLSAPADAKLLLRAVEPGQIVQPGRTLLSLALDTPLQLVAQADERYLEQLQIGQPASVLADAFPSARFAARLVAIAPLVDAQRGAIELKFELVPAAAAPPPFLREDMTLSIEVETARRERATVLPLSALRQERGPDAAVVWLAQDGRVVERELRLGLRTLDAVEVLQGLAATDLVLLGATPEPGQRVRADLRAGAVPPRKAATGLDAGTAMTPAVGR